MAAVAAGILLQQSAKAEGGDECSMASADAMGFHFHNWEEIPNSRWLDTTGWHHKEKCSRCGKTKTVDE